MKAEYVDHMGDDLSVVNDARVSFAKKSEWEEYCPCGSNAPCYTSYCSLHQRLSEEDTRLIQYLARGCSKQEWEEWLGQVAYEVSCMDDQGLSETLSDLQNMHTHWTPFAHQSIKLRMKAPVPIRTQCFKHKMGFVENEESRRYIKSTPELFVPDHFRQTAKNVKQGSGDVHPFNEQWLDFYKTNAEKAIGNYEFMIEAGVCPEQARFVLPQGVMVNWIWTGNLASFARFYNQRTDPHAQKEIQDLATTVGEIIEPLFPVSWAALTA